MKLKRHYLVDLSEEGRVNALKSTLQYFSNASSEEIKELIIDGFNTVKLPGIVRREERRDLVQEDQIAVGFSSPYKKEGNRLRIPAYVSCKDINRIISPYDLLTYEFSTRNKPMQALYAVKVYSLAKNIHLGFWGSTGLEVFTGLPYTDENSDLDLLVKLHDYHEFQGIYEQIQREVAQFGVKVDLEVDLPNGYGVKAAELLMDTENILAKSIEDVKLLTKSEIIASISR